jgi:hypothetical protein
VTSTPLSGQILRWPVDKDSRSFHVFVVEPSRFDPTKHRAIFYGAVTTLLRPEVKSQDIFRTDETLPQIERFDLITFPEAFLPADDLVEALTRISSYDRLGCIHVGLRSSFDATSHLIGVEEFRCIIARLSEIADSTDLQPITGWLDNQVASARFNVGCLFSIDVQGKLRVCLHPKMVRSQFEVSVVSDNNMTEGTLLSLVTLLPGSKKYLSVTLQPIICSDALLLDVDHIGRTPLNCINSDDANSFTEPLPDHVDLVSVPACTPQQVGGVTVERFRKWHEEFCATFERVGKGGAWHRHFHATFVIANFLAIPDTNASEPGVPGGLSGGFIPTPFGNDELPPFAQLSAFGKDQDDPNNRWSDPASKLQATFSSRGYIAHLTPEVTDDIVAKMLGFRITAFPRDTPQWRKGNPSTLAQFDLRTGRYDASGSVYFTRREK